MINNAIFSIAMFFTLSGCLPTTSIEPAEVQQTTTIPTATATITITSSQVPSPTLTLQPTKTPRPSYTPSQTLRPTRTPTFTITPPITTQTWIRPFTEDEFFYIILNIEAMYGENFLEIFGFSRPANQDKYTALLCWHMFDKVDVPGVDQSNFFTEENIDYEMPMCPNSSHYEFFVKNNCTDPVYPDPDWKNTCKTPTPTDIPTITP